MASEQEAPQGGTALVFKTEDDRRKALDAIPAEPPIGTGNIDNWRREQDALQDAIEAATIDPLYTDGRKQPAAAPEVPAPTAPADAGDWYKPENWTFQQNGKTIVFKPDEIPEEIRSQGIGGAGDLINNYISAHRYSETKDKEYRQNILDMQTQMEDMKKRVDEYEKKLAIAQKSGGTPPVVDNLPSDAEMDTIKKELADTLAGIDKAESDENYDPDEAAKLSRKAIRLQSQMQDMNNKIFEARFKASDQEREQLRQSTMEEQERKNREEAERKNEAGRQAKRTEMAKTIETFSTAADSKLKMSKPFEQVEREYSDWAIDIAATYFNIPTTKVTAEHAEVAVHNYLNRTPAFITKLTEQGKLNKTPNDLRKYLINTELYLMMQGMEIDPANGNWLQKGYRLPDMETAYDMWKRKKGLKYQEVVDAANKAEDELLRVMNPPGIAETIPPTQGSQAQRDMSKLSKPQAEQAMQDLSRKAAVSGYGNLEEWIETMRRRGPGNPDVELYDKADESLIDFKE